MGIRQMCVDATVVVGKKIYETFFSSLFIMCEIVLSRLENYNKISVDMIRKIFLLRQLRSPARVDFNPSTNFHFINRAKIHHKFPS